VDSAAGCAIHTLPEGNAVWGVASLDNQLYVLRDKTSHQITVYDTDFYRLQRRLNVPGLNSMHDMTVCAHNYCLYISDCDDDNRYIHRASLSCDAVTKWPVYDKPACLSVTDTHSVLVTCDVVSKVKEFTTHGKLLREIKLTYVLVSPQHAIQLPSGQLVVSHGYKDDPVHSVCLVDSDGQVFHSYGGPMDSGSEQMDTPTHLAVDNHGFVFVVDLKNERVLLLSPTLTYVREVVSPDQLSNWGPMRLFLDNDRRRLYVADTRWDGDEHTAGRVVVISV